jgi:hypothetical protein
VANKVHEDVAERLKFASVTATMFEVFKEIKRIEDLCDLDTLLMTISPKHLATGKGTWLVARTALSIFLPTKRAPCTTFGGFSATFDSVFVASATRDLPSMVAARIHTNNVP